jgi:hypothetical protein
MLTSEIIPLAGAGRPEIWLGPPRFATTEGEVGVVPATALAQAFEDIIQSVSQS